MKYLEVAVAAPLHQTLTYRAPDTKSSALTAGTRLLVPLGKRLVTGYLLGVSETAPTDYTIKEIREVLDDRALFPESMIPFFRWIADYYHFPIGEVIKSALPAGLTSQSNRWINLTSAGRKPLTDIAENENHDWLAKLLQVGKLTPAATRKIWSSRHRRTLLEWEKQGWIEIQEGIAGDSIKKKSETCLSSGKVDFATFTEKLKPSEKKTWQLLHNHFSSGHQEVAQRDIIKQYSTARTALKGLADKGLIRFVERTIYRDPFGLTLDFPDRPEKLTDEQKHAVAEIEKNIQGNKFSPILLHGVTGSGKTEVYLQAAEATLKQKRTVLLLVPEIALATQIEAHFLGCFGDRVALLHSGLTKGERYDQWRRILRHEASIVIGARSAIFAPLENIGLIIVDEEHDSAYKQDDNLRYHGRDLAVLRGSLTNATVILGSATPSLATYTHTIHQKYRKLSLDKRIDDRPLPEVEIIDLQKISTVSGHPPLFSPQLTAAIRETLAKGEQSLIFLNRRGYANLMICRQCGQTVQCRDCHISLTLHRKDNKLHCHYCGYTISGATICANCNSSEFTNIGFGTERIEAELTDLFPTARIARLDRDTTKTRSDFIHILNAVRQGEVDVLVGTQMIAKGHHFPNVTLVGVVWADAGLGMPDFKAGERTFQLLSQVTGRAGRGEKPGRVIVQTHQPDHYSIISARLHDYYGFYDKELAMRKQLGFPPYSRFINLCFEADNESHVQDAAQAMATVAKKNRKRYSVVTLGPTPAVLSKLRGKYRWHLVLKGTSVDKLHSFLHHLLNNQPHLVRTKSVKMTVDVDPENMV